MIIPWGGDDPDRRRAFDWCAARWRARYPDWQVMVGVDPYRQPHDPWVKARAVHAAVHDTKAPVLVVADADVACDGTHLAVLAVDQGAPWAVPHKLVWRLTEPQTRMVFAGLPPERFGPDELEEHPYPGIAGGGIVVIPRAAWDQAPLDPRFEGWGGEDNAWGWALTTLVGAPWRGGWRLWHLWHPPQARLSRQTGSRASSDLRRRYRAARRNPARMSQLAAEAHHNLML